MTMGIVLDELDTGDTGLLPVLTALGALPRPSMLSVRTVNESSLSEPTA